MCSLVLEHGGDEDEAAKVALNQCYKVDECRDWADRMAALASYARQEEEQSLERIAQRIHGRAVMRMGQLLREIDKASGRPRKRGLDNAQEKINTGAGINFGRDGAAKAAELSKRQKDTAIQVANIPKAQFEALIEREKPATLRFQEHYEQIAAPFESKFTRTDLAALLERLHSHEIPDSLPPLDPDTLPNL